MDNLPLLKKWLNELKNTTNLRKNILRAKLLNWRVFLSQLYK